MIDWTAFPVVEGVALLSACVLVTLFSVALRVGDSPEPRRRAASIALFVLCGAAVLFGIYLIVPALHTLG